MHIQESVIFSAHNLLHYRGSHTPEQLRKITKVMDAYIADHGAEQIGSQILAQHMSCEATGTTDIEVYIPVDKVLPGNDEFDFVPQLIVKDCLKAQFFGSLDLIPQALWLLVGKAENTGHELAAPTYIVIDGFAGDYQCSVYAKTNPFRS